MAPVQLVIFDCDGVLVDSEPLAMRVLLGTLASEGVQIDPASGFRDFLGRSLASITAQLDAEHGLRLAPQALERMRVELYETFRRELRPSPWVAETLDALTVPYCVASSSQPERIRLSLEVAGLIDRFGPAIFSASMVARGKPDPDLFLHAASAMGVMPENCLVIEDSPAGIAAAESAGMRVFAYAGGSHVGPGNLRPEIDALGPDAVFDDMRALPGLVELANARASGQARLLVAVDVGTSSARAGIVDPSGMLLARAESPIKLHRPEPNHAEYASEQIWDAVCRAVGAAMRCAGARPEEVAGIGFDATCSLVVRDAAGAPLTISRDGAGARDTIAWLDHRVPTRPPSARRPGTGCWSTTAESCRPKWRCPSCSGSSVTCRRRGHVPGTSSISPTSSPGRRPGRWRARSRRWSASGRGAATASRAGPATSSPGSGSAT